MTAMHPRPALMMMQGMILVGRVGLGMAQMMKDGNSRHLEQSVMRLRVCHLWGLPLAASAKSASEARI